VRLRGTLHYILVEGDDASLVMYCINAPHRIVTKSLYTTALPFSMPEFIDPVFTKTSPKRSFSLNRKRAFWLVFAKTGSIISGTILIGQNAVNPVDPEWQKGGSGMEGEIVSKAAHGRTKKIHS
jgi:hypothetical protein